MNSHLRKHLKTVFIAFPVFVALLLTGCGGGEGETFSISGTVTGASSVAMSLTGASTANTTAAERVNDFGTPLVRI